MRLIAATVLVLLAGVVGWLAGVRLGPEVGGLVDFSSPTDRIVTSAVEPDGKPIQRIPQPVQVVVAQDGAATAPDQPVDLTEPRGTEAAPATPAVKVTGSRPVVDESALRYFARLGDQRRLDAEIARLRALYPDWVPPADPLAPEIFVDTELDALWKLFSEGKYAEVRSGIAERRAREPDWVPPESLLELLDQADARIRLTNASNAKQWKTVIDTAAAMPSLLTCDYVDVLWRVAEAFANTDRMERAKDAYTYVLANCNDPGERVATMQKAIDVLPEAEIPPLLVYERDGEFAAVIDTLLRRRVGITAENPDLTSSPEDLARIEALAADEGNAADALLLGWYYYRHKEAGKALEWFEKARKRDPTSAKAVEGYTLALIELDRFADAETASYDWNEKTEDNLAAYLIAAVGLLATDPPLKIPEPVLERMAQVIVRVKSLQGGEQLGWYAYNLGQVKTAVRWFETVRRWDPNYEPAAYGLAVARWALKDRTGVNAIIREWGDRSERIANIGKPVRAELRGSTPVVSVVVDEPVVARTRVVEPPAYAETEVVTEVVPAVDPGVAVVSGGSSGGSCASGVPTRSLSPESALRRGWCLMDLNRPAEAAIAFEIALLSTSAKTREDAAYGASLANLRSGVTDRASVAAAAAPMSSKRQAELTLNILSQQATAAYADGRYVEAILALDERARLAPEQTDLMLLRGWSYFKLGRYPDARRIFQAVALTGVPDARDGLAAVQAAQSGINKRF
jgi:tetratricopeptide (TPR) repeat protein